MQLDGSPLKARHDLLAAGAGFALLLAMSGTVTFFGQEFFITRHVEQPLVFNHRLHVEDEGLDCNACHVHFEHETYSGLPPLRTCSLCHLEAQGESEEEARLVDLLAEGGTVEWQLLFRQPPHVFFSHRRHVVVGGLECASCHDDIGASLAPPTVSRPLTMKRCIVCHEESGASTDCSACHR